MLELRRIESEADWKAAIDLKRNRAFGQVIECTKWTQEEVAHRYEQSWNSQGTDFHEMMLRRAAEGGDLLGWFIDRELVAYAAIKMTNLCGDDGPLLCTTGDFLILAANSEAHRDQISLDLIHWGSERGAASFDFLCDAADQRGLERAGMRPKKVAMQLNL